MHYKIAFGFQDNLSFSRLVLKTKENQGLSLKPKGFQDDLCSLGLLENQIELVGRMRLWDPNRDAEIFHL